MASNISICGICDLRHFSNTSTHWCQDCDEALCSECREHHTLLKATRGHTVIQIDDYQKLPSFITDIKQYCDIHSEKYQNYCQKHDCPICCKCIQDHAKCAESILPLETVIEHSKTSQIFPDLKQSVSDLQSNITSIRTAREDNLAKIADQCQSEIKKIREFRIRVNHRLDAVEKSLITKLQESESKCSQQIKEVVKSINELESEITNCDDIIQGIKQHASELQVYLATREIERQVLDKEKRLTSMMENKHFDDLTISLEINPKIENILSEVQVFGTVSMKTVPTNYKLINVKSRQAQIITTVVKSFDDIQLRQINSFNIGNKNITGCTFLPDGRMAFAEYAGMRLLIKKVDGNLDFEIQLKGDNSFDVTVVDATTVAVSVGSSNQNGKRYIHMIDINSRQCIKTIDIKSWSYGVVCVGKNLVFCGFKPNGIHKIDLTNDNNSVINSTIPLATWSYITYFKNKLYVTNDNHQTVSCCDEKGHVIWTYKDETILKRPRGITVDNNGNLFVCCALNNVIMISPDGKRAKQILSNKDGVGRSNAIYYDRSTNRLLVACYGGKAFMYDAQ